MGRIGNRAQRKCSRGKLNAKVPAGLFMEQLEVRELLSVAIAHPTFRLATHRNKAGKIVPLASTASANGITPATMRHAYGVDVTNFASAGAATGAGQTIAIVDAYNEPTLTTDLAAFDSQFGLAAPPSLTIENQSGGTTLPAADAKQGWGVETALDVEWAHSIAPGAKILLVEATTDSDANLYAAVDTARNTAGVSALSMSWGGDETSTDPSNDSHFQTPAGHTGITFLSSSGDNGSYSDTGSSTQIIGYPAASPNVLAIGGTYLSFDGSANWTAETGWGNGTSSNSAGGSGGGISKYKAQPSYQKGVVTQSTTYRTIPDVSFDADPNSGVPVYSSYDNGSTTPWEQVGGTSLASPMWAGVMALVDQGRVAAGLGTLDGPTQTLKAIYALPSSDFHDITSGNNGYAAAAGYDLVTGRGTPIVNKLVPDLVAAGTPTIGSLTDGATTVTSGGYVSLYANNVMDVGGSGTISSVSFYRESNGNSGLQTSGDTLVGTGVQSGSTWTLAASTTGLTSGNTYTYYAVASDGVNTSAVSSVTATVSGSGFSNWSTLSPILSKLPQSIGLTKSTSVVNFGSTVYTGQVDITKTLDRLRADNGPIETDDGDSFSLTSGTQPTPALPTNRGTFYEFTVNPQSGSNPSFTNSQVADPGPMRLLIDADGDVYFTGDHYSTDQEVFAGGGTAPSIFSLTANPTSVAAGTAATLTAAGVSEAGGTISTVKFYRESDGQAGLATGTDTLVGTGTASGTTWTISAPTTGLAAGAYTYYAVATDSAGYSSVVSSTSLTVTSGTAATPTIGSFTINPTSVQTGTAATLTAANVTENGGTISSVKFYLESNGTSGLQTASDTLVGTGTQSGTTWTISAPTTSLTAGTYTYYALATDANNATTTASASLTVTSASSTPSIGSFNISPTSVQAGTAATLTAANVTESGGTISSVKFYLESNGASGLQTATDTLIGTGTQSGTTWTISAPTTSLAAGTYTYYAQATDANNVTATASAMLTVTAVGASTPTVGALTIGPSAVSAGGTTTLTASNVTDTAGTISSVAFYRESNGVSGYQSSDTLVGSGTRSGNSWTLSNVATTGLAAGGYTFYAVATDSNSVTSAAASALLTITAASGTTGDILGFDVSGDASYGTSPQSPSTTDASLSGTIGLTRASGVTTTGTAASKAWGGGAWSTTTAAAGVAGNEFFSFGLTVKSGYTLSLTNLNWNYRRSSSGPADAELDYSINGAAYVDAAATIALTSSSGTGSTITPVALPSALQNLAAGTAVTFRIVPYGATSAGGTAYVYDTAGSTADDLFINGSATPLTNPPTLAFHASNFTANEADGTATITVDRSGATSGSSTVQYLTSDNTATAGTDYTATTGTLTFNAGDTSETFTVPLKNVSTAAGTRSLNLALFNPSSGSQTGSVATATLSISDNDPLPSWVSSDSSARWLISTETLTVTGAAKIIADPGSDEPNIVDGTWGSILTIAPVVDGSHTQVQVNIGSLTLSGGAKAIVQSVGSARTATNHLVLVVAAGTNTVSIDGTSQLDLQDNDMIVHGGSISSLETQLLDSRDVADGDSWDGTHGITSSTAAAVYKAKGGTEVTSLGYMENDQNENGAFSTFDGVKVGAKDDIIKYTYVGDIDLNGAVDGSDAGLFGILYDGGKTTGHHWYDGDLDGDGLVDSNDAGLFGILYGDGTSASAAFPNPL